MDDPVALPGEQRRPDGSRPALTETDATVMVDLHRVLEPATKGGPDAAAALGLQEPREVGSGVVRRWGIRSVKSTILKLLALLQYRRQVKCRNLESSRNPDRDTQFEDINAAVIAMLLAAATIRG